MDYIHQTVKREVTKKEKRQQTLLVFICIFIFGCIFFFASKMGIFSMIGYIAAIAVVYYACKVVGKTKQVYDYTLDEGRFTVLLTAQRKQDRMFVRPVHDFLSYTNKDGINLEKSNYEQVLYATKHPDYKNNKYICFRSRSTWKPSLLVISPDETMDRAILDCLHQQDQTEQIEKIVEQHTKTEESTEQTER